MLHAPISAREVVRERGATHDVLLFITRLENRVADTPLFVPALEAIILYAQVAQGLRSAYAPTTCTRCGPAALSCSPMVPIGQQPVCTHVLWLLPSTLVAAAPKLAPSL
jgi:hypothetical protein